MSQGSYADWLLRRRAAAGWSQRELAARSGVKQPLISAIEQGTRQPSDAVRAALDEVLRMRPSQLLHAAREEVLATVSAVGGSDVRLFGSVAAGTDDVGSDLDLLITFPPGADIVTLLTLEEELSELLSVPVDVVSAGSSGAVAELALAESIPL